MKKLILASALLVGLGATAQNGAAIEYKVTSSKGANGSMKINFSEFGHSSEFNMVIPQMPGGGMVMKSLSSKTNPDVIYMINEKSKTYSEMKKTEAQGKEDNTTYTVKKIGDETINGYKCIHATVTSGTKTEDVWNTKDVKEYNKYSEAFTSNKRTGSLKREQALKDAGCDGFPVKMMTKGGEREGDMTMELVKMDKKNFSASDFQIPAGYTKSDSQAGAGVGASMGIKTQEEIMKMTPEERAKYVEEMKKKYGK